MVLHPSSHIKSESNERPQILPETSWSEHSKAMPHIIAKEAQTEQEK
jgi:hypothetical protein